MESVKTFPNANGQRILSRHYPGFILHRREVREERHRAPCCMSGIFSPGQQQGAGVCVLSNVHIGLWVLHTDICSTISSTCQPWSFRGISYISRGVFFIPVTNH